jgi:hypothetical protein
MENQSEHHVLKAIIKQRVKYKIDHIQPEIQLTTDSKNGLKIPFVLFLLKTY